MNLTTSFQLRARGSLDYNDYKTDDNDDAMMGITEISPDITVIEMFTLHLPTYVSKME